MTLVTDRLDEPLVAETEDPGVHRAVPGEAGVWYVVIADTIVFAIMFAVAFVLRSEDAELWRQSQESLSIGIGVTNTAVLLCSSLAIVVGVHAVRARDYRLADRAVLAAMAFGLTFIALKSVEWGLKIDADLEPGVNDFYMMYFALTGMHLLHVVIGLGILGFMRRLVRRGMPGVHATRFFDSGAVFWHMVDMLWLVLFAVVYLVH